jgi:Pretoxin HINT domain
VRASIPLLVLVLLFPAAGFAAPRCDQINPNFCALGNCTSHTIQWRGDCDNHNREWRCIWGGCWDKETGADTSAWIPCSCPGEPGGCDCVLRGTPITMADGSAKSVESIQKGDRVLGFDQATHSMRSVEVVATHAPFGADHYYVLNGTTRLTGTHPVFARDSWFAASELKIGDVLVNTRGLATPIFSIERVDEEVTTYNFQVQGGTYVAGGIVVHNKDDCQQFIQYPW